MGKDKEREYLRLQRSFIPMLCVFLACLFLPVIGAKAGQVDENPRGSVDALEKTEPDRGAELYAKYIEDPENTDVFYELFYCEGDIWMA